MILVTGGAGYIDAHVTVELISAGAEVLILDNLCDSSQITLERIAIITGRKPFFICADVRNRRVLDRLFDHYPVEAVIHCAGLKAVSESVREPLRYFATNVGGSITLCEAMAKAGSLPWFSVFAHCLWRLRSYADYRGLPYRPACQSLWPIEAHGRARDDRYGAL